MTKKLMIRGKVQGVFYRASARETALKLDVKGWVRNTESGDVEALVSGSEEQVERFIEWCRKGPEEAAVSEVIVNDHEEYLKDGFSIMR